MFTRLIWLFGLVLLAAALASWLGAQPGMLSLEWLGWQMEMRTSLAVALLVVLAVARPPRPIRRNALPGFRMRNSNAG